jgi:hypothetical protein
LDICVSPLLLFPTNTKRALEPSEEHFYRSIHGFTSHRGGAARRGVAWRAVCGGESIRVPIRPQQSRPEEQLDVREIIEPFVPTTAHFILQCGAGRAARQYPPERVLSAYFLHTRR